VFNFIYITAAIPVIETNPDNVIEKQSGNIIDLKTNMLYIYMCVIFLTFFFFLYFTNNSFIIYLSNLKKYKYKYKYI